jgi:hypothetical protein
MRHLFKFPDNLGGNMSYFPILIMVESADKAMVVKCPEDLPQKVVFKILKTNYDEYEQFKENQRLHKENGHLREYIEGQAKTSGMRLVVDPIMGVGFVTNHSETKETKQ